MGWDAEQGGWVGLLWAQGPFVHAHAGRGTDLGWEDAVPRRVPLPEPEPRALRQLLCGRSTEVLGECVLSEGVGVRVSEGTSK